MSTSFRFPSPIEISILQLLAQHEVMYGREIITGVPLSTEEGKIQGYYKRLHHMVSKGLLARDEDAFYSMTDFGRKVLSAWEQAQAVMRQA